MGPGDSAGASGDHVGRVAGLLLEREAECETLAAALRDARDGSGSLTAVQGPPGIGKSRLLDEAIEMARGTGTRTITARANALERVFPFGIILQLFELSLRAGTPDQRSEWLSGPAAVFAPLLLSGKSVQGPGSPSAKAHGFLWLATNMAVPAMLLVVDDVQWADPPSLSLLAYLRPRLCDLPIAVVVGARSDEESRRVVAQLGADRHLRPRPLSATAGRRVVRDRLVEADDAFCDACQAVSGGNPFLLESLVAEAAAEGMAGEAGEVRRISAVAPDSVVQVVLARLGELPAGAGALAQAVAVLGDGCALRHAARLAGIALPQAVAAADAMASADILRPAEMLGFVHPLVAAVVEADIGPHAKARAHRQAATLLANDGLVVERLVAHLLLATAEGDPWVVDVLRRAAVSATAQGAPDAAVVALRRARAEPPPVNQRAELLVELGVAEMSVGSPNSAATLADAMALLDSPPRRAEVSRVLAAALGGQGRHREAAETLERAIFDLADGDPTLTRELQAAFVSIGVLDPALAPRAMAMGDIITSGTDEHTPGERVLLAHLAIHRMFSGGSREEVATLACRAWSNGQLLADEGPDGDTWDKVTAALSWVWDTDASLAICDAVLEEARRRGSAMAFATASMCRSLPRLLQGRVPAAVADLESAVTAVSDGWSRYVCVTHALHALALAEEGRLEAAARAIDLASAPEHRDSIQFVVMLVVRARIRLIQGRPGEALEDCIRSGQLWDSCGMRAPVVWSGQSVAALAAMQVGDRSAARSFVEADIAYARQVGSPEAIGRGLRVSGVVEGGTTGIELLTEAVATLAASTARLEYLEAIIELGIAHRRCHKSSDARRWLTDGAEMARRMGASRLEGKAVQELAVAGVRSRRVELTGLASLTPSEMRVVEMASGGLSNRQIAQALFVTTKAIEWHLGNAYRKLGINSRAGLCDALQIGT